MPDGMLWFGNAGKVVYAADRVERRNHADALRIDDALDDRLADGLARLLKRGNRAGGNRFAQQRFVDAQIAQTQMQQRDIPVDLHRAVAVALDTLGDDRRRACAHDAPLANRNEQNIQSGVHHACHSKENDRRFAVSDAPERRREDIILKRKQKSDKDDPQIPRRHRQNIRRHIHQPKHRLAQRQPD